MAALGRTVARLLGVAVLRAAVVLLGFVATAAVAGAAWGAQDLTLGRSAEARPSLTIEGGITGLVPGAVGAELRLTLHNASATPAPVTTVTATVTDALPACAASLHLGAWHGAMTVPARGTATVTVPVALAADLPAACAGMTWGLGYTAY